MIGHACPHCHEAVTSNEHLAGLTIACPHCRERISVPEGGSPPVEGPQPAAAVEAPSPPPAPAVATPPPPASLSSARLILELLAIGAALLLVACGLAWLLAGTSAWLWTGRVGLVLLVLAGFAVVGQTWTWLKARCPPATATALGWMWALCLYAAALVGSWFWIGNAFAWGTVHVDNFSPQAVVLELDASPWLNADARSTQVIGLRRGKYLLTVRARDSGKELDRLPVEVDGVGDYVLNVLRAQVYARGTARYGVSFVGPDPEEAVRDAWFKADVDHLFEEPPASVTVSSRGGPPVGGASRTYLRRGPPQPAVKR
jgi:hypothetical protein